MDSDNDAYSGTWEYISPMILDFAREAGLPEAAREILIADAKSEMALAIQLYNNNQHRQGGIKFSTYFLWWIYERTKQSYPDIESVFE